MAPEPPAAWTPQPANPASSERRGHQDGRAFEYPAQRHDSMSVMDTRWVGQRVRLREITSDDRQVLVNFDRTAARAQRTSRAGYQHWAAHRATNGTAGDDLQLGIEALIDGSLVGSLCTTQTQAGARQFSYGIGIGIGYQRHGYADDALRVLLAQMFTQRAYRACEVSIYGDNHASLYLHHKLGFREQGRRRDPECASGPAPYLVRMAISAEEFGARNAARCTR